MKAKKVKHPKILWVAFGAKSQPYRTYTTSFGAISFADVQPYHLHPGNEAKLKHENARCRRWLKVLVNPMSIATRIATWTEIRRVMPKWFKTKRRGSK